MKKRKELDALLGKRCRSYQQLQRDTSADIPASSSSHDVYFHPAATYSVSPKKSGRSIKEKNSSCTLKRCFYFSLPLCLLALIAACITSSVGVVWMQMQLKSDIDLIKERLLKLERWKNDEVPTLINIQQSIGSFEKDLVELKEGESGIRSLQGAIAALNQQVKQIFDLDVSLFKKNLTKLNKSVNAAEAGLVHLKHKVDRFEQSSEISSEHLSNLRSAMDELQEKITTLVSEVSDNKLSHASVSTQFEQQTNATLDQFYRKLTAMEKLSAYVKQGVESLESKQEELTGRVDELATQCEASLDKNDDKLKSYVKTPLPAEEGSKISEKMDTSKR